MSVHSTSMLMIHEQSNGKKKDFTGNSNAAHTHNIHRAHQTLWHIYNNQLPGGGACQLHFGAFYIAFFIAVCVCVVFDYSPFVDIICYRCRRHFFIPDFCFFSIYFSIPWLMSLCILEWISLQFVPVRIQYLCETDDQISYTFLVPCFAFNTHISFCYFQTHRISDNNIFC